MHQKEIVYDPDMYDFAMYLDGELIGFAGSYEEADQTLTQVIFERLCDWWQPCLMA